MTRENISYELFINREIRYANIISYMNLSKAYSPKEIDSLYQSSESRELDLAYLLGTLVLGDLNKANKALIEKLASNESEFRNKLLASMKSNKNNQIKSILELNHISLENIQRSEKSQSFLSFSPKRFIELIVSKKDLKILRFFNKKKALNQKDMKEFIES